MNQWSQSVLSCSIALSVCFASGCKSEKQLDSLLFPGEKADHPVVVSTTPVDGSLGFAPGGVVSVLFSTPMDEQKTQDAFRLSSDSAQIQGSFSWEWNRLIFRPRTPLQSGSRYTLSVSSSAESSSGVDLGTELSIHFYVGTDIQGPRFVSSIPASGALDVNPLSTIRLIFSEPVSYASLSDGLQISPAFSYTLSMENGGSDVVILPANPLPTGTLRITLNQRITDPAGNVLNNETTFVFVVGSDFIAPGITSAQSGGQTLTENLLVAGIEKSTPIVLNFSEAMNRATVEDAITISPSVPVGFQWATDDELHLNFTPSLEPETNYTLRIATTARDQQGNGLDRTLSYPFLTDHPDSIRPILVEVRQFGSSSPSIPCSDNAIRGAPLASITPLSPIDTSMWIDQDSLPGSTSCTLQFRFLFNNQMVRSSLVDALSTSVILHPAGDLISLSIHDIQMDPFDSHVMILFLGGEFPPGGINETPIIRFSVRGGDDGARDTNGNTMSDDAHIYVSY